MIAMSDAYDRQYADADPEHTRERLIALLHDCTPADLTEKNEIVRASRMRRRFEVMADVGEFNRRFPDLAILEQ